MFGTRLRLARRRAGLSMRSLAAQMDPKVSAQAISRYEAGKMMPSSAVLVGLANALGVSLDFLLSTQIEAIDGLELRKHSRISARERARAEAVLIDTLERSLTIEGILGILPACSRVESHRCSSIAHWEEIDAQADALRSAWNLGLGPLPGLCALLEARGIRVVEGDLPQRIGVLACRALRGCTVVAEAVLLSNQLSIEQKRIALAHELAQRIVGSTGNPEIGLNQARDRFASAFLVPRQHLREAVGLDSVGTGTRRHRTTWHEIIQLKQMYGVSAATLLTRLEQVGALSATAVRRAFRTFARPWRKIEPEPIVGSAGLAAFERPRRLERLVWRAVGEDLISPVRAAALLNMPFDAVEERITGPIA